MKLVALVFILLALLLFHSFYFLQQKNELSPSRSFQSLPNISENKSKEVKIYKSYQQKISNFTINITHPLLYPNLRWQKMPILVKIDNFSCSPSRIKEIRYAMNLWEEKTNHTIRFKEVESNYQLYITCTSKAESFRKENVIISKLGEGGPTKIIPTDYFNLTLSAFIKIASTSKSCIKPIRVLHEIGHTLGLAHVKDEKSIMYPYESCDQDFTPQMINTIKEIYKVKPLPDLYFLNASASVFEPYLNLTFVVKNGGIASATDIKIEIYADESKLYDYNLSSLGPGQAIEVSISYLYAAKSFNTIKLVVDAPNEIEEYAEENNIAFLRQGS